MSEVTAQEKLKLEKKRIEEQLRLLRPEKSMIEEKLFAIVNEEEQLTKQLRDCRDEYKYNRLDMRLNTSSRCKREIKVKNEELERKIRGLNEDIEKIGRKIKYLKPR